MSFKSLLPCNQDTAKATHVVVSVDLARLEKDHYPWCLRPKKSTEDRRARVFLGTLGCDDHDFKNFFCLSVVHTKSIVAVGLRLYIDESPVARKASGPCPQWSPRMKGGVDLLAQGITARPFPAPLMAVVLS
jgi:hypothetical protein